MYRMSAPLPLRFYNPVKELCAKVNLDYETVIGTGLSSSMREVYINSEIEKPVDKIESSDKKFIEEKKQEFESKYGTNKFCEDKGMERYTMGLSVEYLPAPEPEEKPKEGKIVISGTSTKHNFKWIPGKGTVNEQ